MRTVIQEGSYNLAVSQGVWQGAGGSLCHVAARLTGAKVAECADSTEKVERAFRTCQL
jgi:hypothetical protein